MDAARCNDMEGPAGLTGSQLVWPAHSLFARSNILSTVMLCNPDKPEYMAQEHWVYDLLRAHPTIEVRGDELVITKGTTEIHLLDSKIANPDRPLVDLRAP
ncbi:META domain-containing protein [Pendulispora albinea]|uniref:META domain-containing protein n=1 Tax=Pendulispora albinea TaxID=2741071 RepID=A0ABZ2LRJ3_9BACT